MQWGWGAGAGGGGQQNDFGFIKSYYKTFYY